MLEQQANEIIKAIIYQAKQNGAEGASDLAGERDDVWIGLRNALVEKNYTKPGIKDALAVVGDANAIAVIGVTIDTAKEYLDLNSNNLAPDAEEEAVQGHIIARQHMTEEQANLIIFALIAQAIKNNVENAADLAAANQEFWDVLRQELRKQGYTWLGIERALTTDVANNFFTNDNNAINVEDAKTYLSIQALNENVVGKALTEHFNSRIRDVFKLDTINLETTQGCQILLELATANSEDTLRQR